MIGINPAPLGVTAVVLSVIFIVVDTIVLGLRLWAKKIKRKQFDLSDYFVIVAWVRISEIKSVSNSQLIS
jgi:hypothetical protein